jgi:hypothetical protein
MIMYPFLSLFYSFVLRLEHLDFTHYKIKFYYYYYYCFIIKSLTYIYFAVKQGRRKYIYVYTGMYTL